MVLYLEHGLELPLILILYKPEKILAWFVKQVTDACRTGDVNKEKAIFAETFKLHSETAMVLH